MGVGWGCIRHYKNKWSIKGVGVKKIMEKIHEIGKYMVGGDFLGGFSDFFGA